MANEHDDDLDPPQFVMTQKDSEEVAQDLLPSPNLDLDDLAEGTILPRSDADDVQTLAVQVLEGKWGSSEIWQVRRLRKAGHDVGAVMAEVKTLCS